MSNRILFFLLILSTQFSKAQNDVFHLFNALNDKQLLPTIPTDNLPTKIISSDFPNEIFKISPNTAIYFKNRTEIENAILFQLFQENKFKLVADLHSTPSQSILIKKMIQIELDSLPTFDLESIQFAQILNSEETILEAHPSKSTIIQNPITITYFTNYYEAQKENTVETKILIEQGENVIYEAIIKNQSSSICYQNPSDSPIRLLFQYGSDSTSVLINNGLWNFTLHKRLEEVSDNAFLSANYIKNVSDYYNDNQINFARTLDTGSIKQTELQLSKSLIPIFEQTKTFELENNTEKVVTWHSQHYKESETNYKNGLKEGKAIIWNSKGNTIESINYSKGKKDGNYVKNYSNLSPHIRGHYSNDTLDGDYISYYKNGQKEEYSRYLKGRLNGKKRLYYIDGQMQFKGRYKNDVPVGFHSYYDQSGKREKVEFYWRGKNIL